MEGDMSTLALVWRDNWMVVLLLVSMVSLLVIAMFLMGIRTERKLHRRASASRAESDLTILWQAMESHAMVNISDAEGKIVYVNDTFVAATGYSREELIGRQIVDFLLTPDNNDIRLVQRTVGSGATWLGESKFRRKDGSLFWTRSTIVALRDSQGRLLRTISLRTDITESKLRQAEAQFRALHERLRDEVYMFDADTLRLSYINTRAREVLGWADLDYKTMKVSDTVTDFDEGQFRKRTQPLVSRVVDAITYESFQQNRPVEVRLQLEEGVDGKRQFIAVVRDITQRKQAEAARSQIVATVSHELRSPLTSVMGALKLVASGALGAVPEKPASLLAVALRNVDRVILMINDLLDLEKLDAGKMEIATEPTDLSSLLEEALVANAPYAAELGVTFRCVGADRPRMVEANHVRMIQVLNNLLSNAAKFSRPGGVVEIELRDAGGMMQIQVKDNGVGIPEEAQGRLFERFAQAGGQGDHRRNGTGLGLSIAKAIVEGHRGQIRFTSKVGVGTTFTIDLPKHAGVEVVAA